MNNREPEISTAEGQIREEKLREILQERARILSEIPTPEESGEKISLLSFQLGEELYGIALHYLIETRQSVPLRHLPCAPSHLVGIINLRGELVPVVDLCPILGLPQREVPKIVPALLIASLKKTKCAFMVDRPKDILTVPAKEIHPPPLSLEPERALWIRGEILVENRPLSLLDVDRLLQDPRLFGEETQIDLKNL